MPRSTFVVPAESFATFGEMIRYLRKRVALSQRELALQVGYHYTYMSRIENNEHVPDSATLMARFIPALKLDNEPTWTQQLLKLAGQQGMGDLSATDAGSFASSETDSDSTVLDIDPGSDALPASLTPLLGRDNEVAEVLKILRHPDVRLLTLSGPPGIGKTRLAIEATKKSAGMFAHGMKFFDLASLTDPDELMAFLAQGMKVSESPDMPLSKKLAQALKQKNMLLVLDNFEQLIAAAPQIYQLLSDAPGIKFLVTSRVPLHISGENVFTVPPLSLPQTPLLEGGNAGEEAEILKFAAIRLFVERAIAAQPAFQLTPQNIPAVVEICSRLDGLPLAIELAAARIRTFSPQTMLKQFDRRFDWLAPHNREAQASKQTLRGAIEWSYNLLSEKEQILFRRLAVFSFGRTVETAETICADPETNLLQPASAIHASEIFDLLIQLTDKSLLYTEVENEETRFKLLETIHDFAREKLSQSSEETEIRNRHLACFCNLAQQVEVEIEGANQVFWANRCEIEHANMRAAMEWSLKPGADLKTGIRLATHLGLFWFMHSHFIEGLYWFRNFLPKARELGDDKILAKLLFRNADLLLSRGAHSEAWNLINESIELCRNIDDKLMLGMALYIRADLALVFRDLQIALDAIQESIALGREIHYPAVQDIGLILRGRIQYQLDQHDPAYASLQEGLALAVGLSDYWGMASGYRALGDMYMSEGNYVDARKNFEHGLEPSRIIGDKLMTGNMLTKLVIIANSQGQYPESSRHAGDALAIFQTLGDESQQPLLLRLMGYAAIHAGNLVRARVLIRESLLGNQRLGDVPGQLAALVAFAQCSLVDGDVARAVELCALIEKHINQGGIKLPETDTKILQDVSQSGREKLKAGYDAAYNEGELLNLETEILKLVSG